MAFNARQKKYRLFASGLIVTCVACAARAQPYAYAPAPPVMPGVVAAPAYTPDQLDQMLGPIALYPDPLLSEVLAAATYPQDVAAAAQWLQADPTPPENEINAQPWDPSVKAIVHFPDVVQMMAGNMDWTEALGSAFASQQPAVMDSVQRLRARALAAHTLVSTPQQEVVQEDGAIEIYPVQPDAIYVPEYDPTVVYAPAAFAGPFLTFSQAYPFGGYFDLGFDYAHHRFLRDVRFDPSRHRFDFARSAAWEHDRNRPIPVSHGAFVAPRGWNESRRGAGAFRPDTPARREPVQAPRGAERPVNGLPAERHTPEREPAPQRAAPEPVERRAAPVPTPARPAAPQRAEPARNERPVNGIPTRSAPAERATPAPVERAAPVQRAAPAPVQHAAPAERSAPSSAFRPSGGGGAASAQGHASMHR